MRFLRATLSALLLLGLVAAPVGAAKPQPTANASVSGRGCDFVISYAWSKFSGRNLIATIGLYDRTDTGDVLISSQSVADQVGRTGSVGFTLNMTPDLYPSGRTLVAIGSLTDTKTSLEVDGSAAESPTQSTTCG